MKISKSFIIYIHILLASIFSTNISYSSLPNNLTILKESISINKLIFKDVNLKDVDLTKNKGNIMIINFWATWCAPCRKEMASLDEFSKNYPEILVFPINMEKPNVKKVKKFYKNIDLKELKIFFDPDFKLAKTLKLRALPTSFVIDKKGKIVARIIGEIDFNDIKFTKFIEEFNL